MAEELVKGATSQRIKRLVDAGTTIMLAETCPIIPYAYKIGHIHFVVKGTWRVCRISDGCVAIIMFVLIPILCPVLVITIVTTRAPNLAVAASTRALGSFPRAVDAFDTLGATSLASGHVAGTSGLATMATQTCLLDSATRQGQGPVIGIRVVIGAWEPEPLAVGTDWAKAVTTDFAKATS